MKTLTENKKPEYKWVFTPTGTYFRNRKEAKMCLGGSDRFNYLLSKGLVRYL